MAASLRATSNRAGDRFWQAVLAHDCRFDGRFVYAVRSTGVYCRPSCPSRRPRRDQVVFYTQARAAEQDGFRACRRCGESAAAAREPGQDDRALIERAVALIEADGDTSPTLAALGAQLGLSPHRLARRFKRATGVTPREFAEAQRLRRLKASLRTSENVAAAVYDAGYGSSRAVYERARGQLGMTPGDYRRGGAGQRIGYTIVGSPLGRVLIATTERGLCRVALGESDSAVRKALLEEYPKAEIRAGLYGLREAARAFQAYLEGEAPGIDLPLDVRATAFQWKVWRELRKIPCGQTRSYTEVARAIGRPKAVRAVAHACASNPVALVVPCHRVLRRDGSLGGYRWGLKRKQALLDRERRQAG